MGDIFLNDFRRKGLGDRGKSSKGRRSNASTGKEDITMNNLSHPGIRIIIV